MLLLVMSVYWSSPLWLVALMLLGVLLLGVVFCQAVLGIIGVELYQLLVVELDGVLQDVAVVAEVDVYAVIECLLQ